MKKILISFVLIFTFIGYFFLNNIKTEEKTVNKNNNKTDFLFNTAEGEKIKISALNKKFKIESISNKIIFLKVFGWNCMFCEKEIPQLIKLKEEFADAFDIIAIESQNHSNQENREKIKEHGINYSVVSGNNQEEFYAYLKKEYKWLGIIPLTIIIGEDGQVLAFEEGVKSYSLAGLLKMALLKRKKAKGKSNGVENE
jgi:thiol-disulfide isomerase/thioredoxin